MTALLTGDLAVFADKIVERERRMQQGTPRTYYLVVPHEEYRCDGTTTAIAYSRVRAPNYEMAVRVASANIDDVCMNAQIRKDIIGWKIDTNAIRRARPYQRAKCRIVCTGA